VIFVWVVLLAGLASCAQGPEPDPELPPGGPATVDGLYFYSGITPKNAIVIVIDTLAVGHLASWGGSVSTPWFDDFVEETVFAEQAWACATWTLPSFECIYTGRVPLDSGFAPLAGIQEISQEGIVPTLGRSTADLNSTAWGGEFLTNSGVRVTSVGTNPPHEWHFPSWYESHTDHRYGETGWETQNYDGSADWVFEESLAMLEASMAEEPEGGWIHFAHLMDPHTGLDPDGKSLKAVGGTEDLPAFPVDGLTPADVATHRPPQNGEVRLGSLLNSLSENEIEALRLWMNRYYDAEVYGMLGALERFLWEAGQLGALDDSLVVVLSDHGESLGERGSFWMHNVSPYQAERQIALMFWAEHLQPGRFSGTVTHSDVLPTLVEILDIQPAGEWETWAEGMTGWSVGHAPPERVVFTYAQVLQGMNASVVAHHDGYALIYWFDGRLELYDTKNDPLETVDLSWDLEHRAVIDELWPQLETEVERLVQVSGELHFVDRVTPTQI
jgi:arylsulfatase A-like enzyme